ncbi:MAG TPA: glycosyltransferase [Candidatus Limnocylindrales bacterium]|nr:glycosyltransferase [Candidatus Limnocylindrales bacterium]
MSADDGLTVAYVMSRFPKLTETFILAELEAMDRAGVRIELFPLLRQTGEPVQPAAVRWVERAHYEPFLSVPILRAQWWFLSARQRRRRYLRAFFDMLAGTWRSPNFLLGGLGIFPKVARMAVEMETLGVQHVHCHFANHPALAGWLIQRLVGIPYSFTAHGSDLHVDRTMLPTKVDEAAFVATISHDNRALIEATAGPSSEGKVAVVHCGVDPAAFVPVERPADGPLRIVAVGTLHEVKGQVHLIEACRLLTGRGVAVTCRFIGDGPDREALQARIDEYGLRERVVLAGRMTTDAVAAELAAADVLVAPSVPTKGGKREGIPVVLMEAMSTGLPVVASRLSGIPELVTDGVSGLLVPPGDDVALADALAALAADPALRRRLGMAGRDTVLREFDVDRNAAALADRIRRSSAGPADPARNRATVNERAQDPAA